MKGVLISLTLHTVLDSVVGLISGLSTPHMGNVISQNTCYVLSYVFLTLMAVVSLVIIQKVKRVFHKED